MVGITGDDAHGAAALTDAVACLHAVGSGDGRTTGAAATGTGLAATGYDAARRVGAAGRLASTTTAGTSAGAGWPAVENVGWLGSSARRGQNHDQTDTTNAHASCQPWPQLPHRS